MSLAVGSAVFGAGPTHAAPGDYDPPTVTVETPTSSECQQREKPPPPIDTSEDLPPGVAPPEPLPVPNPPVGGVRMGECGPVLPAEAPPLPSDISARAWLIADLDTGEVVAAKDPHGRYRPASTLKLLTALTMAQNLTDLEAVVEGTAADTEQEGTRVGLEVGGSYTVRDLMTYLLIVSGNDAAFALARTNGGMDKTLDDMNELARSLGALDSRAATVSGLDRAGQSVSAYDLALFAKALMANPLLAELIGRHDVRVAAADGEGYIAANDNRLLYNYQGALGGKTGFTDDSGNTYVGMAQGPDGRRLAVTMLDGTQRPRAQWMQAASLLDWAFALPPEQPAVGQLVNSLEEATAPPPMPMPTPLAPAAGVGAAPTSAATPSTTGQSGGMSTTVWVLIGIGVLVLAIGAALLIRRRVLNRRPTFAGDAKPAPTPEEAGAAAPADAAQPATEPPAPDQPAPADAQPQGEQSTTPPSSGAHAAEPQSPTEAPPDQERPPATPPAP